MLSHPQASEWMRELGLEYVATERNWGVSVANYRAIYEQLLAGRDSGTRNAQPLRGSSS